MTNKHPNLKVEKRKSLGRKVKKLRKEGFLPVNLYGKDIKSQAVKLAKKDFLKVYGKVGETGVLELEVVGQKKKLPVLIHNVQLDPVLGEPLHVEFRKVDLKKKIIASVPLVLKGEAPAVNKGGVLVQMASELEVEALPNDLPEKIIADVSGLKEIDQFLAVEDLKIDKKKIELKEESVKRIIVKIEEPTKEKVVEEKKVEEEKPEEGEKKEGKEEREESGKEKPDREKETLRTQNPPAGGESTEQKDKQKELKGGERKQEEEGEQKKKEEAEK